jgi:ferredoxin-fold anticodon binding domain-containing protein
MALFSMFCAAHCLPCLSNNISSQDIPPIQLVSSRIDAAFVDDAHEELVLVSVKIGKRKFFGGYSDVFEGEYHATDGSGAKQKVAIKCLRIHVNDDAHSDFKEVTCCKRSD